MLVQTGQEEKTEAAEAAEQTVMETDKEEVVEKTLMEIGEEELVVQTLLETEMEEVVEQTLLEIGKEEVAVMTGPRDQENVGIVVRLGISVQSVSRKKAVRSTAWLV